MDLGLLAYLTYCYAFIFIRTQLNQTKLAMKAKVKETGEVVEVKCTRTAMYLTVDMSGEGNTQKYEETELEFIGEDSHRNDITLANAYDTIEKLRNEQALDAMYLDSLRDDCKFYKDLLKYLINDAVGDKMAVIQTLEDNFYNRSEGNVQVTKSLNDKQELILEFADSKGDKYKAKWMSSDGYACYQTCGYAGDDYSGYLLFPTYKDNEYFCVFYQC